MYKAKTKFKSKSHNARVVKEGELFELEAIYHNNYDIGRSKVELNSADRPFFLSITHDEFNEFFEEVDL